MSKFAKCFKTIVWVGLICAIGSWKSPSLDTEDWGFYAHREINMLAVFLLPPELVGFYKRHINFIKEHAVDPDKRRYALTSEAPKHYIDFEYYFENGHHDIPNNLSQAIDRFLEFRIATTDSLLTSRLDTRQGMDFYRSDSSFVFHLDRWQLEQLYFRYTLPERLSKSCSWNLGELYPNDSIHYKISVVDHLSEKGINPYHIPYLCRRLENAMRNMDINYILRLSADLGHYVSDNCVPLHCTSNYNGQETNQLGIHAFWESRLPELFAEENYDFFIDKAEYISNIDSFAIALSKASYHLVPKVLAAEKRARAKLNEDQIWCYGERREIVSRMQCPTYAEAFSHEMDGMVEQQMRLAIQSVASLWYSCWHNAGKPKLITTFSPDYQTDSIVTNVDLLETSRSHED